ncbi:helix-turn-helix transcriptional regulator [Paenibacillus sp. PAMC21692]|uniref:ArsR/SmtB family transcription factor n=1 Tax=Paenibacillus sp. PAMC21692 TaxID=2762320 RepID=UPI00164D53DD|nr:helix-turn-helix domain-containing protein [Paenibacillus sp. PAMC21692]QNK54364.1 helix-turn-helix transcriptional regulator [Paenibacillus sp. PAMC21692]
MKVLFHPDREDIDLSSVLYALSDPLRLAVVSQLHCTDERSCGEFDVPIAKSTLSHHVRTLREAGVVRVRSVSTQRLISLRSEDLEQRFPGVLESVLKAYEASGEKKARGAADPAH